MLPFSRYLLRDVASLPGYWYRLWRENRAVPAGEKIAYGPHPRQYFRLHLPAKKPVGLLIYFHGGGWQYGSPEMFRAVVSVFEGLNLAIVLPSYRRIPEHDFGHIHADLLALHERIASLFTERDLPRQPCFMGGMSAGAHLAALSVLDPTVRVAGAYTLSDISAVFLCGGVLDLDAMPDSYVIRSLAGARDTERWQAANPLHYLSTEALPPTLVIHGTADGMVPYAVCESFVKGTTEYCTVPAEMHTVQGGGHMAAGQWLFTQDESRKKIRALVAENLKVALSE